jgi:hypothetical protein
VQDFLDSWGERLRVLEFLAARPEKLSGVELLTVQNCLHFRGVPKPETAAMLLALYDEIRKQEDETSVA